MNLLHQVELLSQNIPIMEKINEIVVPIHSDLNSTRNAYWFASLFHPARDIITKIGKADRGDNTLPSRLRLWNIKANDGWGNLITVHLRRILNAIMHMNYLQVYENTVDVANDESKRFIVDRITLIGEIRRLLLSHKDVCLVACALANRGYDIDLTQVGKQNEFQHVNTDGHWNKDLWAILTHIQEHIDLADLVWNKHFSPHAAPMGERDIVNHQPFPMSFRHRVWEIGWRRDDLYANPFIDVFDLIQTIRSYCLISKG